MARCVYCHEADESKLILSSRFVNGRVKTIDICLRCFWLDKFKAEARGDGRMNARVSEEEGIRTIDSAISINPLGLQE